MKRKMVLFLIFALCLVLLVGCEDALPEGGTFSGTVLSYNSDLNIFKLTCEDGLVYGFVVDDATVLDYNQAFYNRLDDNVKWAEFGRGMQVTVQSGLAIKNMDEDTALSVEGWFSAEQITVTEVPDEPAEKPVIYLYPETPTTVTVRLELEGELICSYPRYEDGWTVVAEPDGTLTDAAGQQYSYLYWEGLSDAVYDLSRGFCVPGEEAAAFLETALEQLGLTRQEANEFIVYWLPKMEANEWNLISFQTEAYTDWAVLDVMPVPDTVLRVFMVWRGLDAPVKIEAQTLTAPTREGFTLVEWGGTELK